MSSAQAKERSPKRELREGFTTGTAAAAGAKAATLALFGNVEPGQVDTPLPGGGSLVIAVHGYEREHECVTATVRKDAGDDPDVTHQALISATVSRAVSGGDRDVFLTGGKGVGTVTLPGLPVAVGEPAINPGPREQIRAAVLEAAGECDASGPFQVVVAVDQGEELAQRTMNPRLGIVGGISILGTRGTVKPYSHESWQATVAQGLSVAKAAGHQTVYLSTGRRSERMLMAEHPDRPETAFVQAADYYAMALAKAGELKFSRVVYGSFFGKLVKMAQGFADTHVRAGHADLGDLAQRCRDLGLDAEAAQEVATANTALQAQEIILARARPPVAAAVFQGQLQGALAASRGFMGPGPGLTHILFHMDGRVLGRMSDPPQG